MVALIILALSLPIATFARTAKKSSFHILITGFGKWDAGTKIKPSPHLKNKVNSSSGLALLLKDSLRKELAKAIYGNNKSFHVRTCEIPVSGRRALKKNIGRCIARGSTPDLLIGLGESSKIDSIRPSISIEMVGLNYCIANKKGGTARKLYKVRRSRNMAYYNSGRAPQDFFCSSQSHTPHSPVLLSIYPGTHVCGAMNYLGLSRAVISEKTEFLFLHVPSLERLSMDIKQLSPKIAYAKTSDNKQQRIIKSLHRTLTRGILGIVKNKLDPANAPKQVKIPLPSAHEEPTPLIGIAQVNLHQKFAPDSCQNKFTSALKSASSDIPDVSADTTNRGVKIINKIQDLYLNTDYTMKGRVKGS